MALKCPKCGSTSLTAHEYFEVPAYTHFENGVVVATGGNEGAGYSVNKFSAVCMGCDHTWWMRYSTGQRVVAASQEFAESQLI